MSYIDSPAFDNDWDSLMNDISSTGVSVLLYGIYINLFLLALYTLSRRRQSSGVKLLIAATCVMAILATAQSALHARALQRAIRLQSSPAKLSHVYNILSVLGNFLFVLNNQYPTPQFRYRFLFVQFTNLESTSRPSCRRAMWIYELSMASALQQILLLTTFIAGRILWVRRLSSHVGLDNTLRSRYNVVLKLMYDNIIPTFTLVYIGLTNTAENPLPAHRLMHQGTPGKPPPLHPRPVQSFTLSCPLDIQQGDTEGEDAEERMNIT
ncbi:hypothetical protein B0H14DRAFT_3070049 [Mycena olivaceomarginata]|nr:hypothetical protein B0H14DRAFT_3070049 [Mycena olivaceomarginata]